MSFLVPLSPPHPTKSPTTAPVMHVIGAPAAARPARSCYILDDLREFLTGGPIESAQTEFRVARSVGLAGFVVDAVQEKDCSRSGKKSQK